MPEILRVALLGGGKMARQHAAAIRQCKGAKLVAVADPRVPPAELRQAFGDGIAVFGNAEALLAAVNPDVVHVVTPPDTHVALAGACLEAGANVYVEKPFALSVADANAVLDIAAARGLHVCAAHQVLFQDAGRAYRRHLPEIGDVVHVESFFSFRPVRRGGGGALSAPVDQLIDILPHPVYVLLDALPASETGRAQITALDVSADGEVRAVIRRGDAVGSLVVSLRARPVESWLRVMATNGMVEADFVLGNVIRHSGPGASAPAVVLKPFSRAWQIGWGSLGALLRLLLRRHRSYPGLAELLELFYSSIRLRGGPPVGPAEIVDTVRICESIGVRLRAAERAADERAEAELHARELRLPPLNGRGAVLLTGGTGMLGRPTASALRAAGWQVRVPVRRPMAPRERLPGIEYVAADLAESVPDALLAGVETVVHLAAETAGSLGDHERNTVRATRNLLEAMARSGARRLVNVSSVAVLRPARLGRELHEASAVDYGNLRRGPYVWAKAEAERLAQAAAESGGIEVRTVRLGPLVDHEAFTAPGRLGREIARLFVAAGRPSGALSVCGLATAAQVLAHCVSSFQAVPPVVNLLDVPTPTRGELIRRLRQVRPDLRVLWLPFWILRPLSAMFRGAFAILRPTAPALDIYSAFKSERYAGAIAGRLIAEARSARSE